MRLSPSSLARLRRVLDGQPFDHNLKRGVRVFFLTDPAPPVPLYRIPLSTLMAASSHSAKSEAMIERACSDHTYAEGFIRTNPIRRIRDAAAEFAHRMVQVECEIEGFTMAFDRSTDLLVAYDGAGSVVGGISQKSILVLPDLRGQGLGAEILVRAFETGVMHPDTMNKTNQLTTAGRANRRAAHRIAVERAVKAGVEVGPDILSDYADLVPVWKAGDISTTGQVPGM